MNGSLIIGIKNVFYVCLYGYFVYEFMLVVGLVIGWLTLDGWRFLFFQLFNVFFVVDVFWWCYYIVAFLSRDDFLELFNMGEGVVLYFFILNRYWF